MYSIWSQNGYVLEVWKGGPQGHSSVKWFFGFTGTSALSFEGAPNSFWKLEVVVAVKYWISLNRVRKIVGGGCVNLEIFIVKIHGQIIDSTLRRGDFLKANLKGILQYPVSFCTPVRKLALSLIEAEWCCIILVAGQLVLDEVFQRKVPLLCSDEWNIFGCDGYFRSRVNKWGSGFA